jgi:Domain of unknown function (DUF1876)
MTNRREPEETPYGETPLRMVTITDDNATIAVLEMTGQFGDVMRFTGSAKREPGDQRLPMVGKTLAVARAMQNAAETLESAAKEYVASIYGD